MDIFKIISTTIALAKQVHSLAQGIKEAPEILKRLANDAQEMELILNKCDSICERAPQTVEMISDLLKNAQDMLRKLRDAIKPYAEAQAGSSSISSSLRLYMKRNQFEEMSEQLQSKKLTLSFICL
jgi:uncharacterized coiled-coil DUF342 family protein